MPSERRVAPLYGDGSSSRPPQRILRAADGNGSGSSRLTSAAPQRNWCPRTERGVGMGAMGAARKPRFSSVAAALRFYFRARELLHAEHDQVYLRGEPCNRSGAPVSVMRDYRAVDVCLRELDGFQVWLIAEIYGPTGFAARQRTVTRAC